MKNEHTVSDFGHKYANLTIAINKKNSNKEKLATIYMWIKQNRISKMVFMSLLEEVVGDISGIYSK
jgi:hypothetical protein